MYKKTVSALFIILFINFSPALCEGEIDLKQKCEEKCREAVNMIKVQGIKLAFKELNNKKGSFVWNDSFVYTIDIKKGIILTHNKKRMIGKLVTGIKNINGREIYREFMDKGEREGKGWISYMWKKRLKYVLRYTYVISIPKHNILVISSTYNISEIADDKKEKKG